MPDRRALAVLAVLLLGTRLGPVLLPGLHERPAPRSKGIEAWEGRYYHGDGLGINASLSLSGTRFEYVNGGCLGTYDQESGSVERVGERRLKLNAGRGSPASELEIVPWGARTYLLSRGEMIRFVNAVNAGWEPRFESHGFFFLKADDHSLPAPGLPSLSPRDAAYLLSRPVEVTISRIGVSREDVTDVVLVADRPDALLAGMELHRDGAGDVEVTSVRGASAVGRYRRSPSKPPPKPGWSFSTRYSFALPREEAANPFSIVAVKVNGRPGPIEAPDFEPRELHDESWAEGAEGNGFTVTDVAVLEGTVVDPALFSSGRFERRLAETLASLGANAFREERRERDVRRKGYAAYRVDYQGKPLEWLQFPIGSGLRSAEWAAARAEVERDRTPYAVGLKRLYGESLSRATGLSFEQTRRWTSLHSDELTEEQRRRIEALFGRAVQGRLISALRRSNSRHDPWKDPEYAREVEALQRRLPEAYAEWLRSPARR